MDILPRAANCEDGVAMCARGPDVLFANGTAGWQLLHVTVLVLSMTLIAELKCIYVLPAETCRPDGAYEPMAPLLKWQRLQSLPLPPQVGVGSFLWHALVQVPAPEL